MVIQCETEDWNHSRTTKAYFKDALNKHLWNGKNVIGIDKKRYTTVPPRGLMTKKTSKQDTKIKRQIWKMDSKI